MCEACGRSPCVSMVGHDFRILNVSFPKLRVFVKNIVPAPASIYFATRRVVRRNLISRVKDWRISTLTRSIATFDRMPLFSSAPAPGTRHTGPETPWVRPGYTCPGYFQHVFETPTRVTLQVSGLGDHSATCWMGGAFIRVNIPCGDAFEPQWAGDNCTVWADSPTPPQLVQIRGAPELWVEWRANAIGVIKSIYPDMCTCGPISCCPLFWYFFCSQMQKLATCKIALMKLTEQWSPRWQSIGVRMTFWDYSAERYTWGKDYSSRTWGKIPSAFGIMFETQTTQPMTAQPVPSISP